MLIQVLAIKTFFSWVDKMIFSSYIILVEISVPEIMALLDFASFR